MKLSDFDVSNTIATSLVMGVVAVTDCEYSKAYGVCGLGTNCSGGGGQCGLGTNCSGGGGQCGLGTNCSGW